MDLIELARKLIPVVCAAGAVELKYYNAGQSPDAEIIGKDDGSPVTLADQEAEKLIFEALQSIVPDIPVVGEEATAAGQVPDISSGRFFLVDPLDGTKEFITGGGDFTVNIGLLENFKPVMGIVYAPVSDTLWYGANGQAFVREKAGSEQPMQVRPAPDAGLTVVASKRHGDPERLNDFLRPYKVAELKNYSSSLKFCAIAQGLADLYPRLGPTSEWDTAAGEAVLRAAGGDVTLLDGAPMPYGKVDRKFLNYEFLAKA